MKRIFGLMLFLGLTGVLFAAPPKFPPFYQACLDGKLSQVKKLVEKGADINEPNEYGVRPLEAAASQGKLDVVEYLLSKGAELPQKAFEAAAAAEQLKIVEYFLAKGTESPQKAYDAASSRYRTTITKFLLENGYVDVNLNASYFESFFTVKDITLEQKMQNVKDIAGDKLTSPYLLAFVEPENYQKVIDFFGVRLTDKADSLGGSILHIAAKRNNYDLVKYLLGRKFNINVLDDNNQTALFYAVTYFGPRIDWTSPVIEDDKTAKIHFVSDMPYFGNTRAVQQTQVSIVTALLDGGINVNQQDKAGWTVLHFTSSFYPEGLQELLVSKGARSDLKTNFGRTAADIRALRK